MNTKKVISKFHWKHILMLFFTIVPSFSIFIIILKKHIENPQKQMTFEGWLFLDLFVSFGILFIIRFIILFYLKGLQLQKIYNDRISNFWKEIRI
ncbi:hypothetical protein NU10_07530 [Flavobacterium dauae]|uniref:hypothetical protein n=1 Tax=Flavobacterium dauae TaxID=1563479 RepID=UPI00101B4A14|nr:hypothetical protein [Flavobacterium dauae]WLD22590.1 hypothetical protein NU10_07530 [Flavobacterium dauae]